MREITKRLLSFVLASLLLLQFPLVGGVQATEVSAQSADALYDTVAEQVKAFAKSIDQSGADDTAAKALAKHGISGNGKKLLVGKSHGLTATLWNSELFQVATTASCVAAVEYMQMLDKASLPYLHAGYGWRESNSYYNTFVYSDAEIKTENKELTLIPLTTCSQNLNSYDNSLNWMVGDVRVDFSFQQKKITKNEVTYEVKCVVLDRFDFDTSQGSEFDKLISGLGALLFVEFDWESNVTFELTVPYSCDHSTRMYHFTYDAANRVLASDSANGFTSNTVKRHTYEEYAGNVRPYYHELDNSIRLYHDKPWVVEYSIRKLGLFSVSPLEKLTWQQLGFVNYSNSGLLLQQGKIVNGGMAYDCYGIRYDGLLSNNLTYTFRLENEIDARGNNMIYLTITNADTQAVVLSRSPMDDYYENVNGVLTLKNDSSDYLNGVDLFIRYFGNKNYSFHADYFDLKIWENGVEDEVGDFYTDKVTAPTCAARGYTTRTCACCGYSYKTDYTNKIPHTYIPVITAPTCAAQGYTTHTCKGCGDSYVDSYVPAVDHEYEDAIVAPTCTEQGYTTHTCSCGDSYVDTYVDALGHKFTEWVTTEEATCTEEGSKRRDCARCDHYETEVIEASGHNREAVVTEPTCTEQGYTTHTCKCGDSYVDTYVNALAHRLGEWENIKEATCTEEGSKRRDCERCDYYETEVIEAAGHKHEAVVTAPTCTEQGYTTHACKCGDSYVDTYVDALDHRLGQWTLVAEPNPAKAGQERRGCDRCDHFEIRSLAYEGNALILTGDDLTKQEKVWIEGMPYPVITAGDIKYVELPSENDCVLVIYTYQNANNPDVHTQYPSGMKVYKVSGGEISYIKELDNLLQYSGSSIRITGKKGIRMITSLTKEAKTALTGKGLASYKLVEYGTALCWASEIKEGDALVLGKPFTRSNYAYKKGVADPVFATTSDLTQYTNVLVGFDLDQCKDDIAMRPYIILEDGNGEQITLYGGIIYRSIGYIAYQNRNVFQPKTGSYDYVWEIIHHVYGDLYDADYKG